VRPVRGRQQGGKSICRRAVAQIERHPASVGAPEGQQQQREPGQPDPGGQPQAEGKYREWHEAEVDRQPPDGATQQKAERGGGESLESGGRQRLRRQGGEDRQDQPARQRCAQRLRQQGTANGRGQARPSLLRNASRSGATEAMLRSLTWPKPRIFSGSLASAMASPRAVCPRRADSAERSAS
jgi:hypothetical protein